jgi:hypothetical protein
MERQELNKIMADADSVCHKELTEIVTTSICGREYSTNYLGSSGEIYTIYATKGGVDFEEFACPCESSKGNGERYTATPKTIAEIIGDCFSEVILRKDSWDYFRGDEESVEITIFSGSLDLEKIRRRCRDALNKTADVSAIFKIAGLLNVKI